MEKDLLKTAGGAVGMSEGKGKSHIEIISIIFKKQRHLRQGNVIIKTYLKTIWAVRYKKRKVCLYDYRPTNNTKIAIIYDGECGNSNANEYRAKNCPVYAPKSGRWGCKRIR